MHFLNCRTIGSLTALALMFLSTLSIAQEERQSRPDQLAETAMGKIGQRQNRELPHANVDPTARINNRIANRVQSRIKNRIDRDYDPQANATSPFEVAAEKVRKAGAQTPR